MRERLNPVLLSLPASGIRRVAERARELGCVSLTLGEPSFDTPVPIREATKRALDAGYTHYPPNRGVAQLSAKIAGEESGNLGVSFAPEQALVTVGSTEALACTFFALLSPGDEVIVPTPGFLLYAQQIALAGGIMVPLYTAGDHFQINTEALEACVTPRTKAILLNSPNNPTGVVYTRESLNAAEACCLKYGLFMIFDGVYSHLCYDAPMCYPGAARLGDKLIYINAFSKRYAMTGWRMGYVLAGHGIIPELTKVHAALTVGVATFLQMGCLDIFDVPVEAMAKAYRQNRDLVIDCLSSLNLPCARPAGAFYAFPDIRATGMDDETFVNRLMTEQRVALVPGNCFGAPGFVRLSYCTDTDTLKKGLDGLCAFMRAL